MEPGFAHGGVRRAEKNHLPIVLGGDHCLGIGSISAVARHCRDTGKKLRVLWLDAHADFNTYALTPSGNIHGMSVACLCGFGPQALIEIGGHVPAISPKWVRRIGIRSVDKGEKRFVHAQDIEVFDMRYIDEMGMCNTMELALAFVAQNTHLHVSFDVGFLDPDIAPCVGTTVRGGPSYREAQLCMEMIADTGRLASLDVMELNPALDERNRTAEAVVDLIASIHGDPRTEYPFFLGHADERGAGEGFNLNLPLPRGTGFEAWWATLQTAIQAVSDFTPQALVVPLGLDTFEGDPISGFTLQSANYIQLGRAIAQLGLPTVLTFEGGYAVAEVGLNTVNVLEGLVSDPNR